MADFLDEKRREMQERIKELRPLVDEYHRLEAAVQALDGVGARPAAPPAPRRRATAGNGSGGDGSGRRGRPRGSGTRGRQALELVRATPGITIPDLAEQMGIQQNYLYRVLPALQKEGMVRKEGRGWHPMEAA
ncbi:Rrf2 family transcriptional regulator [Baekduia soli]|uniref:Rrf2 family transcriptional regulator n=1 Tax=Baekduia soli TaxID=496014 RepID=A0A5B8U3L1_9ACTN|nr:winged helix-turn-helix transcriptional regulator [Baekduia soli]QEC47468.1 Rrf2 family transcriptional regulator [Baekduia soli]